MAKAAAVNARVVKLTDLTPDPNNLRLHPERSKEAIGASVRELGAARSIVVDGQGVVRAGNGTLEAAAAAGITEAVVIETDGKQLVVVKRPDWTPEQALAYAIADNRAGELSHFDPLLLQAAMAELAQDAVTHGTTGLLDALGYTEKESAALLGESMPEKTGDVQRTREVSFVAIEKDLMTECPRCKFKF